MRKRNIIAWRNRVNNFHLLLSFKLNFLSVTGYSVADTPESALYLTEVWLNFIQGKSSIDPVIDAYISHGFVANQVNFVLIFFII